LTGAQFCHAAPALAKIEPRRRSELKRRTLPGIVSGLRASERIIRIAPAFACIAPGSAPPHIQPTLARGVESKKLQYFAALRGVWRMLGTDKFIVHQAAVRHDNRAPRLDADPRTERKSRSKHHGVQKIAVKTNVICY